MDEMPVEVLYMVFDHLDAPTLFNAALVCRRWNACLSARLPSLHQLHIDLDSTACEGRILHRDSCDTSTIVCQCHRHATRQGVFLEAVCQRFGKRINTLSIEDSLLYKAPKDESVQDSCVSVVLRDCSSGDSVHQLEFHDVDFRHVFLHTLSIMKEFSALTAVHFYGCRFPDYIREAFLLHNALERSCATLETIAFTDCRLITDRLARYASMSCPRLHRLNLTGCQGVTALTVVHFCEQLSTRHDIGEVVLDLRNTSLNYGELDRYMNSAALSGWRVKSIRLPIAFERPAMLLTYAERMDCFLTVLY